jgi:hypothetical protein
MRFDTGALQKSKKSFGETAWMSEMLLWNGGKIPFSQEAALVR